MKKIILFLLLSLFSATQMNAQDQMTIKMNGHAYQVDNVIDKKIHEVYEKEKAAIIDSIKTEMKRNQSRIGSIHVTLPDNIAINYSYNTSLDVDTLILDLTRIKTDFVHNDVTDCRIHVNFNLKVKYLLEKTIDSAAYKIRLVPNITKPYNVSVNTRENVDWIWEWWAHYFVCPVVEWAVENYGDVDKKLEKQISKSIVDTTFTLFDFADLSNNSAVDPAEITAINESFPIRGTLSSDVNGKLVVEANFLEGDIGQYTNITPDAVPAGSKLDIGGFAFLHYNLQGEGGFKWHESWNSYQRIEAAFNKMKQKSITGCRVEARWDAIQSPSEVVLGQNPSNITDADINALMNNGSAEWLILDYILDKAYEKGIIVHIAVGIGHDTRPPGTIGSPNASISPDNSGSLDTEGGKFIAVSANDYLYNLELSSRAIIRKYKNRVGVWQIENELNAARFTESFKWWRKGNLWRQDQPGGFQDDVWNTMINAVRTEDPRSKIIHDFHMFDIEDRLERWGADCDIIGVNFYPNQLFAYPVLDFAVGEYVWAVRRVLKGLGMGDKNVWVTETGYPAKTNVALPETATVDDDIMHFSHERQTQYIENAIQYSIDQGAKGFFYYSLTATEDGGGPSTPALNRDISYSGLILPDGNDTEKPALANFGTKYVAKHPGIGKVRLFNRYNGVNIGNKVSLKGERDFIDSGDETLIVKEIKHTGRTELEKTVYNTDKIKHHDWDGNSSKFKMDDNNLIVTGALEDKSANFKPINTGSFTISTKLLESGAANVGEVQLKDPWFVENDGQQLNQFKSYSVPFTPGSGAYSWYDGLFLGEDYNNQPIFYSLKVSEVQSLTIHGDQEILAYFQGWSASGADLQLPEQNQTPVVFRQDNAQVTAVYKGHLATSLPDQADSKNQRRLVQDGDDWVMVYEDAGDIWLTSSNDQGASWQEEIKLNMRNGYASNPSVSNILSGQFYLVTWLEENASGDTELHLQTMRFPLIYGWTGSQYGTEQEDGINHRIFDQPSNGKPDEEARPVVYLEWDDADLLATLASECDCNGIRMSKILFEEDGPFPSVVDLEDAEALTIGLGYPNLNVDPNKLGFTRVISTSQYDKYPNVISVPPSYGGAVKTYIYYAQSLGYNAKIYQYDIDASSSSYTTLPSEFAGIFSLQAAACAANATIALAVRTSACIGGPNVVVYERPSYGGLPQIKDVYRGYDHPSVMIKEYGGFNSSGADHLLMMENTSGNWYKSDGSSLTSIGSDVSGVSMRPSFASGDNRVMYTKTYPELPALIKKYSGSGALLKGSVSGLDVKACRYWKDSNGIEQKSVLDFSGVEVGLVDSLETGSVLAAFKILSFGENGLLVSQPDTMATSFAVEIKREGKTISAYQSSKWNRLSTASLPDVRTGDILLFSLDEKFERLWDFRVLNVSQSGFSKSELTEQVSDSLQLIDGAVSVYPNPFNPVTYFHIVLPEISDVELRVYNTLGQMVSLLHKGELPAGKNNIPFDGSTLSSGIYFYQLKINHKMQSGKLTLVR